MSPLRVACDVSRLDLGRPSGAAAYALFVLDLLARDGSVELCGPGPAGVVLSLDGRFRAGRRRSVAAVMDIGHLLERGGYSPGGWLAQNWRVAGAARRSDHLLVPSAALAAGLHRYLHVDEARVTVLAQLPGNDFRRPPRAELEWLRRRLGLPARYLLFSGTGSRRKNLGLLGRAWAIARPRLGGTELLLAGRGATLAGFRSLGWVEPAALPGLLGGAVAWLNPSLYEGSPIGALEAMACGTPPLVAATGAQPRAVEGSGLALDPHDPAQWAEAISAVVQDAGLRSSLSRAGLKAVAGLRARAPGPGALVRALGGEPAGGG